MAEQITGYPPQILHIHPSLAKFASVTPVFFACRSVDRVNTRGTPKKMIMLVTKEFVFISKENCMINRAVWLQDIESIYMLSNKLLIKTKSNCSEPGLILMSHEGDTRNNPNTLQACAETIALTVGASIGVKPPVIRLEVGGSEKPYINMQKSKTYMKPNQKLKILRNGGGFKPLSYPSQGQQSSPPPPPVPTTATYGSSTVNLIEEPPPPSFPVKEKESPPIKPIRKASITPKETIVPLDEYVFTPQPPSPSLQSRPPRKDNSPSRNQKRLSLPNPHHRSLSPTHMSRVGSVPSYPHRHSSPSLKRHSSSRKDGFWKEFVRDYDALEKQWEVDQDKRRHSLSSIDSPEKRMPRRPSQDFTWAAV